MKRKNIYILLGALVTLIVLVWIFTGGDESSSSTIEVNVRQGRFIIDVTTTGELEARSSENIMGPNTMALRNARIWQLVIEDIVPDGTVVDSGEWVATLDRSDLENKIKDQELEVEKYQTQFVKTQLDTSMTLRSARDELINMKYGLEEKKIIMDQSIYEPPATQRQVKMDYEKAQRTLEQAEENYDLKYRKAKADMKDVASNLAKAQRRQDEFIELMKEFTIKAPKSGMVNYKKNWDGKKLGVGAQISSWDNVVATLPNLSAMNSKTYVNEIDISKVKVGQEAEIEVDAFPGKVFHGKVVEVANIGEQLSNSNAKVFEVMIYMDGHDPVLRPSMTTKNRIITEVIDSVLYVPIECVHSNDSISYVFKGSKKQQVIPGKSNENDIIILAGLKKGDEIYLQEPEGADDWPIEYLDKEEQEIPDKQVAETAGMRFTYYLVAGSFTGLKEAQQFLEKVKNDGFSDAGIMSAKELNRVFLGQYDSQGEADAARIQLPAKYSDAWVLEQEKNKQEEGESMDQPSHRKGKKSGHRRKN